MKTYHLKCYHCERPHKETESVTECIKCGGPLETYFNYEEVHRRLNMHSLKTAPLSAMKYVAFYPIENFESIVSLQEGGTPLLHATNLGNKLGLKYLYIKNEGLNPTGVFKDRGTMVEVTKAKELGAKAICLASTGNMAASVAAYASAAKIPCYVLVPEGTPVGKLAQTLTFGARVIQVRADYSRCAELASEMAKKFGYYLAGDYTFRTEGQKSQGYEIIEQLFWKCPDYIVCSVGNGTNFHAIYKGIKEFYNLGLIKKLPKIIVAQTTGCNPLVKAFQKKSTKFTIIKPNTVASAMAVGNPSDGRKILEDVYESGGGCYEVDDEYLLQAQQEMAREEGVFSEPSGALSYAVAKKLADENFFKSDDVIVVSACGNGLKDPKSPLKILPEPATLEPEFSEIERFIDQKLYAIRESGSSEKTKILFSNTPTAEKVGNIIIKEFDVDITNKILEAVTENIKQFITKGKKIKKADLGYILEEVLDEFSLQDRVISIEDFEIKTGMHKPAKAEIWGNAFGKEFKSTAEGVGPVDAAIIAIKEGLKDQDELDVKLIDYAVEIDTRGVDASVEIKMTMSGKNGDSIVSRTTSPDIIVASIKAFEKGFNILYSKR
ncbi:MAG: threonine synthase [Candidatus Gracilibacteria bacterium]|nr:threonine synthase [Candidatus Gracilibacteria bacterium]